MISIGPHQLYHGKTAAEIKLAEAVLEIEHVCADAWEMALQECKVYGNYVYFQGERYKVIETADGLAVDDTIEFLNEDGDDLEQLAIFDEDETDYYDEEDALYTIGDDGEPVS